MATNDSPAIRQDIAWLASAFPLVTKRLGWEVETSPIGNGLDVTVILPSKARYDYRIVLSASGEGHYARVRFRGADGTQSVPMYPQDGSDTISRIIKNVAQWEIAAVTGEA